MKSEIKQEVIDDLFNGTNFGPEGETPEGRRRLVAMCVMKRTCGYRDGHTIETICKWLGVLTPLGNPTKAAKNWAYHELIHAAR